MLLTQTFIDVSLSATMTEWSTALDPRLTEIAKHSNKQAFAMQMCKCQTTFDPMLSFMRTKTFPNLLLHARRVDVRKKCNELRSPDC